MLNKAGYANCRTCISHATMAVLRKVLFREAKAGSRCLLDEKLVRAVALLLKAELMGRGVLAPGAVAVQAIAFDKSAAVNWKVPWHQDLIFPFARRVSTPGFTLPCLKEGIDFARPPCTVLEAMLAVRLHLDDCDETNGPLRVCPGSHRFGIMEAAEIARRVATEGEIRCLAAEGDALVMRPLLLHASSKAAVPKNRRVLHLVYHSGEGMEERWHRAIGGNLPPEAAVNALAPDEETVVGKESSTPDGPGKAPVLSV